MGQAVTHRGSAVISTIAIVAISMAFTSNVLPVGERNLMIVTNMNSFPSCQTKTHPNKYTTNQTTHKSLTTMNQPWQMTDDRKSNPKFNQQQTQSSIPIRPRIPRKSTKIITQNQTLKLIPIECSYPDDFR
jgi:hypothetical protein